MYCSKSGVVMDLCARFETRFIMWYCKPFPGFLIQNVPKINGNYDAARKPNHESTVLLIRRECDEDGFAIHDPVRVGLEPHGPPHFLFKQIMGASCHTVKLC